jgi:hypothetical protein
MLVSRGIYGIGSSLSINNKTFSDVVSCSLINTNVLVEHDVSILSIESPPLKKDAAGSSGTVVANF